ncbi:MAG: alpha/beta fold hydrolase [Rhodobiaceae bacterium]|nr:alpha/beta fold hydrolase [Rhodobiaceae bacterium]
MRLPIGLAVILAAVFAVATGHAETCGGPDTPCAVPLGTYHVSLPDTPPGPDGYPVVVYYHGAGGSGARIFINTAMTQTLNERGYAVIGPNGLKRPNSRFGTSWSFRPQGPKQRDEMAFTREFLDDAVPRFHLDRNKVILSGFSIGGSLVWYLACQDPTIATAYAPVSGGFWRPMPTECAGPVRLLHTHGWRDQTVPLEGRPLRNGQIYQGDIFQGFQVWRTVNGCDRLMADSFVTEGPYWRRIYTSCAPGTALEFALHSSDHIPPGEDWAKMVANWFETLDRPGPGQ